MKRFLIMSAVSLAATVLVLKSFGLPTHRVGGSPNWIGVLLFIYLLGLSAYFFGALSKSPFWIRLLGSVLWPLVAVAGYCLTEYQRYKKMGWGFLWAEDGSDPSWKKKYGWTITLALIGAMALLLVFQQGESIRLLKIDVSILQGELNRFQNELDTVQTETRNLKSREEYDRSWVDARIEDELKRQRAYCQMFPQTKNCKDFLAGFSPDQGHVK